MIALVVHFRTAEESVKVDYLIGDQEVSGVLIGCKTVLDQIEAFAGERLVEVLEENIVGMSA